MFTHPNDAREWADKDLSVTLLNQAANRLSDAASLQEMLAEVVRFATTVVKCDSCMIYVLERDELVLRASRNSHLGIAGQLAHKVGQSVVRWVTENRLPVAIAERAFEDFRFRMFNELPEDRFEAFLSIPVFGGGRLVGVINVNNRVPHDYSELEISLASTIGFLLGIQIERTRLESDNTTLLEKLETRTLVDRAKKILQRDLNIGEEDAHHTMQRESQNRNKSIREIARAVILSDELKQPYSATKFKGTQPS